MRNKSSAVKRVAAATAGLCTGLLGAQLAVAANPETVTASVTFVDAITITENRALSFSYVDDAFANTETIVVATSGSVTDSASRVIGTPTSASLTVTATATQAISILVDSITNGTGYTLGSFTCDYNGGASSGTCSGTSLDIASAAASATLLIGATITGNGSASTGADNGSFNVNVTYQ